MAWYKTGGGGIDVSEVTATANDVLSPKKIVDANGDLLVGTIQSKNAQTYGASTSDVTISAGQYLRGDQIISGDANLVAGNIKKGVTMFGVTGTFEGYVTEEIDVYNRGVWADGWSQSQMVGAKESVGGWTTQLAPVLTFNADSIKLKKASGTYNDNLSFGINKSVDLTPYKKLGITYKIATSDENPVESLPHLGVLDHFLSEYTSENNFLAKTYDTKPVSVNVESTFEVDISSINQNGCIGCLYITMDTDNFYIYRIYFVK